MEHKRESDSLAEQLCNPQMVARHEAALAKMMQTMTDFIERSIEDRKACADRYQQDRAELIAWRNEMRTRMEVLEKFIEGLRPDHKMLMLMAMSIIIGSLSLVWRLIWRHIGTTTN